MITINYLNLRSEIVVRAQFIIHFSKIFNSSSKKRDLNDQSCNEEESKKAREGNLNDSSVSLDDVFTEGMNSPDCLHILVNWMINIEAKVKETCEIN